MPNQNISAIICLCRVASDMRVIGIRRNANWHRLCTWLPQKVARVPGPSRRSINCPPPIHNWDSRCNSAWKAYRVSTSPSLSAAIIFSSNPVYPVYCISTRPADKTLNQVTTAGQKKMRGNGAPGSFTCLALFLVIQNKFQNPGG